MLPKELYDELKLDPVTITTMEEFREKMAKREGMERFFAEPTHDIQLIFSGLYVQHSRDEAKANEVAKTAAEVVALMVYQFAAQTLGEKPTMQNAQIIARLLAAYMSAIQHAGLEWLLHYASGNGDGAMRVVNQKENPDVY